MSRGLHIIVLHSRIVCGLLLLHLAAAGRGRASCGACRMGYSRAPAVLRHDEYTLNGCFRHSMGMGWHSHLVCECRRRRWVARTGLRD